MSNGYVYVVTDVEMGWDCVRGVFSSIESLREYLTPEDDYLEDGEINPDSPYYNASLEKLEELIQFGKLVIHEKWLQ